MSSFRRPSGPSWRVAVVAVMVILGSCSSATGAGDTPRPLDGRREVRPDLLPPEVAGLAVVEEDITRQHHEAGPDSYVVAARLWSLRSGSKLQATLQVGLLGADAFPVEDQAAVDEFERSIAGQVGDTGLRTRVLDSREVFVTVSNEQPVYVWFVGRAMFILSVSKEFRQPRSLLRQLIGLQP